MAIELHCSAIKDIGVARTRDYIPYLILFYSNCWQQVLVSLYLFLYLASCSYSGWTKVCPSRLFYTKTHSFQTMALIGLNFPNSA